MYRHRRDNESGSHEVNLRRENSDPLSVDRDYLHVDQVPGGRRGELCLALLGIIRQRSRQLHQAIVYPRICRTPSEHNRLHRRTVAELNQMQIQSARASTNTRRMVFLHRQIGLGAGSGRGGKQFDLDRTWAITVVEHGVVWLARGTTEKGDCLRKYLPLTAVILEVDEKTEKRAVPITEICFCDMLLCETGHTTPGSWNLRNAPSRDDRKCSQALR